MFDKARWVDIVQNIIFAVITYFAVDLNDIHPDHDKAMIAAIGIFTIMMGVDKIITAIYTVGNVLYEDINTSKSGGFLKEDENGEDADSEEGQMPDKFNARHGN